MQEAGSCEYAEGRYWVYSPVSHRRKLTSSYDDFQPPEDRSWVYSPLHHGSESQPVSDGETSFSMLMNELNREIDRSAVFGVTDLQEILSNKLKPLMKNVLTESYHVLHLSENLRQKELQMPRDQDEVQICRISTEPTLQLSETDTMRLQLYDLEQRLVRAEEEKMKLCTELQEKVCASENMVQSLQLELSFSQRSIQLLSYNLLQSADSVQSLKVELKAKEEKIHLLDQRLLSAQESTKLIQKDLDVSK
ncbi:filamin-A-interacting protein 1-like isoform X1, partial [Tachysurus ichikawai]